MVYNMSQCIQFQIFCPYNQGCWVPLSGDPRSEDPRSGDPLSGDPWSGLDTLSAYAAVTEDQFKNGVQKLTTYYLNAAK